MEKQAGVRPKHVIVTLFVMLMVGAAAGGIYLAEKLYYGPMREQQRHIANLKMIVEQMTRDVRMAEVMVIDQSPGTTVFRFVEVDENQKAIGAPKTFTVQGDEVYFDTLVIKFEDNFKSGDELPLKQEKVAPELLNKSIILFRRVFSDKQKPEEGTPIDPSDSPPNVYRPKGEVTPFEIKLWQEFWQLANDPKLAKERGVRAAHGQAVSMKLQKGKFYILERRLSGDLTIRPVDLPAVVPQ
jgi:hypothetical protein